MSDLCLSEPFGKVRAKINNLFLWRYVREEHRAVNGVASHLCFNLTVDDHGYLSFSHSNKVDKLEMVKEAHRNINLGGRTKPAVYMSFDMSEVYNYVNNPRALISFEDKGYPHIGMFYLTGLVDREVDFMEVKTILLELSSFYLRFEGGRVEEIAS